MTTEQPTAAERAPYTPATNAGRERRVLVLENVFVDSVNGMGGFSPWLRQAAEYARYGAAKFIEGPPLAVNIAGMVVPAGFTAPPDGIVYAPVMLDEATHEFIRTRDTTYVPGRRNGGKGALYVAEMHIDLNSGDADERIDLDWATFLERWQARYYREPRIEEIDDDDDDVAEDTRGELVSMPPLERA